MSDIVKSLRQKHNSAFTDKIDFQLEGKSVQMIGDLNLEEKLRLDNLKDINIIEENGVSTIIESEYSPLAGEPDYYSITAIKEQKDKTIILKTLGGHLQDQERAKVSIIKNSGITEYYIDSNAAFSILYDWGAI